MHKVGDFVTYKDSGICRITEENQDYYILEPVYSRNMTMYVPKKTQALVDQIHHVLTKDEIDALIVKAESVSHQWIEDSKRRADEFNKLLRSGNKEDLLWLVKVLSLHKIEVEENKKSFYATDRRVLGSAEKIITEEFAFVLGIEPDQVIDYIMEKIEK